MILLAFLFILIIAISFWLSWYSMKDFREKPSTKIEYSLFLIKKPHNLNKQMLQVIFEDLSKLKALISFEKLFKGRAGAQVIYGPKIILTKFAGD